MNAREPTDVSVGDLACTNAPTQAFATCDLAVHNDIDAVLLEKDIMLVIGFDTSWKSDNVDYVYHTRRNDWVRVLTHVGVAYVDRDNVRLL